MNEGRDMAGPLVTVVVVPRERFSLTKRSLESIYANTHSEFTLLYVDGGSPSSIKRYLAEESRKRRVSPGSYEPLYVSKHGTKPRRPVHR